MLHQRLRSISDPGVREILNELESVKGVTVAGHAEHTLFGFLDLCQRDVVTGKKQRIDAAHSYLGSMLRTKVEKLPPSGSQLVTDLCHHFHVRREMVETKVLYVFLNDVFNPKSRLRKLPPIRV